MPPGVPRCVVKHRKCYVVPRRDGHVLVGSTEEHDAGYDDSTTNAGVRHLLRECRRLLPTLEQAEFVRAWAGLRPGTPDRRPYIGPVPDHAGLIAATGHFRTGFGLAPLTADVVADLILRGRTNRDVSRFAPGRSFNAG
jgi:glycine oxidase